MTLPLSSLEPGTSGIVQSIDVSGNERRRLMDLGFVKDAAVEVGFNSPMGDPRAYRIKDTLIALRKETASQITVYIPESGTHEPL